MRQERTVQASIFDLFAEHEIGRELEAMSQWLDAHRDLFEFGDVAICAGRGVTETGRQGLPAGGGAALRPPQTVPPVELRGVGVSSRRFRLVPGLCPAAMGMEPEEVGLAQDDQRDPARTPGKQVNKMLLASARQERLESGRVVRVDSTVTAALIHEPSDSSLLWDCCAGDGASSAAGRFAGAAPFHGTITAARRRSGLG